MNNLTELELLKKAEQHKISAEYKSAIETYKYILENFDIQTIFCGYNLANIYHAELGYGKLAKDYYLRVINWNNSNPHHMKQFPGARKELDAVIAATYENITLLSDSYEELYDWAKKCWELNPEEKNLKQNIRKIKEKESSGKPWKETYFEMSGLFFNEDHSKDRGLYGFGASIFKRLLINRRKFRLDRQQYEFSAIGYGSLMQLIVEKTYNTQRQKLGKVNFDEIEFVINDTITLLNEYLTSNPNDERVKKAVSLLQMQKSKYKPDEDNFEFKKQIVGETRCQNQLVIRANNRNELLNTITELSDILLTPFPETPTQEAFQQEQYNEMALYMRVRTTKDIILQKNSMPTSETYCLVGDKKISPIAWIYNALGMEQTAIKNIQKALEYFEKALNHSPDYSFATYNIATCYAMLGNFEAALPYFEKAAKFYPYDNDIQNDLMYCKQQTGNSINSQPGSYANQKSGCLFTVLSFIAIGLTTFLLLL